MHWGSWSQVSQPFRLFSPFFHLPGFTLGPRWGASSFRRCASTTVDSVRGSLSRAAKPRIILPIFIQSALMPLSVEHRRAGHIAVVACTGRLVEGVEMIALQRTLDELLVFGPYLVLHLGGVEFVDSAGLGLLVRYSARTRNAQGSMKLCAASPKLTAVLKATRLEQIFNVYKSESEAIAAFYEPSSSGARGSHIRADILCVVSSVDVQAYVREMLGQNGYAVLTTGNLPDAVILMQAVKPKLVVVSADLRRARGTHAAEKFSRLVDSLTVIELPPDFSHRDPGDAGSTLLEQVRAAGFPS